MNQLTKIRRAAAATIVVPAVLLAAGCGSSTPTPTAPAAGQSQPAGSTPATSTDAPSTSATSDAPVADGDVDKTAFISALKAASADATSAHVSMSMSGSGQSLKMEGDTKLDAASPAMQLKMGMSGMNLEMLVVDKKVYVKGLPNQNASKWSVFDENSAIGKQMSESAASADPTKMYDQFEKGVTKVKKVGTETVDGEQMDKYALTLDTKQAAGNLAGASTAGLPATLDYLTWIDGKGHMRKVTFEVMGLKATVNMSKYGEPVEIKAPAAGDVVKGTGM